MNQNAKIVVDALVKEAEDKFATGAEKREYVNYQLIGIAKGFIPILNIIPTSVIDSGMDFVEDKALEEIKALLPKIGDFIEECVKKFKAEFREHILHKQ